MNTKEEIKKIIEKVIATQYYDFNGREIYGTGFSVDKPKEDTHGDYSTNVALVLAKQLKKNPMEVAKVIADKTKSKSIEKVQVAAPGFINFYVHDEVFNANIKEILKQKGNFGKNATQRNKKVIVEYTDPNILKEFHIGHLMSNSIGESISRIFEFQGAKAKRANYQGDVGMHVAKAMWGKIKHMEKSWQEGYVFGAQKYETDEIAKREIVELNKKIFERSDKAVNKLYDEGKKWSLAYFETIYKKLGTKFDYYFFESEVADFGKKIVQENIGKIFEKGEKGAIVFKGEKFGLHTRVFINSEGLPTYEAKDLALPKLKYKRYKYNTSIIITANEQNAYFDVMLAALKGIEPKLAEETIHIGHGMMRLPEGKMSSRTGKVVTAESLIDKVKELVAEKMAGRELAAKEEIMEQVAIGALKYSILKQSTGSDIVYDFEKSITFEGDSGPYLQYSLARANSVLEKAKGEKIKTLFKKTPTQTSALVKLMYYFPEVVEKAGKELQPHGIVQYLTELASAFNGYYAQNKIVDKEDEFSPYKIAVTQAFVQAMKNGLWLLGIGVPEKM